MNSLVVRIVGCRAIDIARTSDRVNSKEMMTKDDRREQKWELEQTA